MPQRYACHYYEDALIVDAAFFAADYFRAAVLMLRLGFRH